MSKLYIMMGTPGSGKSTWCAKHINFQKDVYISRDSIRFSLLAADEPYFSHENQVYKEFINKINIALSHEENVYADQTSLDSRARKKLINSLSQKPDEIHVIWIKTPLNECLRYNSKRTGLERVPEQSIIQMYHKQERPTWSEGIKYLHIIENEKEEIVDLEKEALEEWSL